MESPGQGIYDKSPEEILPVPVDRAAVKPCGGASGADERDRQGDGPERLTEKIMETVFTNGRHFGNIRILFRIVGLRSGINHF